jgi:predicted nucleic acid-binding protein
VRYLVDANVLNEPTKPVPDPQVVAWLRAHEPDVAVDPIIRGEFRFGILILPKGRKPGVLERWFDAGAGRQAENRVVETSSEARRPMELFAKLFSSLLVFAYHCFDRIVIHGYLSGLSRPKQMVCFFRDVIGVPVVTSWC